MLSNTEITGSELERNQRKTLNKKNKTSAHIWDIFVGCTFSPTHKRGQPALHSATRSLWAGKDIHIETVELLHYRWDTTRCPIRQQNRWRRASSTEYPCTGRHTQNQPHAVIIKFVRNQSGISSVHQREQESKRGMESSLWVSEVSSGRNEWRIKGFPIDLPLIDPPLSIHPSNFHGWICSLQLGE